MSFETVFKHFFVCCWMLVIFESRCALKAFFRFWSRHRSQGAVLGEFRKWSNFLIDFWLCQLYVGALSKYWAFWCEQRYVTFPVVLNNDVGLFCSCSVNSKWPMLLQQKITNENFFSRPCDMVPVQTWWGWNFLLHHLRCFPNHIESSVFCY